MKEHFVDIPIHNILEANDIDEAKANMMWKCIKEANQLGLDGKRVTACWGYVTTHKDFFRCVLLLED